MSKNEKPTAGIEWGKKLLHMLYSFELGKNMYETIQITTSSNIVPARALIIVK